MSTPPPAPENPESQDLTADPLVHVAAETERYVAAGGWDQGPRLFALADTGDLADREPALAEMLGADAASPLTAIEQDDLPQASGVEELLGRITWPDEVTGCALAVERLVVPPSAEADLPRDPDEATRLLTEHPQREDIRLLVAVLRDGRSICLLRQRSHDSDDAVAVGQDIAPGLVAGLSSTLS